MVRWSWDCRRIGLAGGRKEEHPVCKDSTGKGPEAGRRLQPSLSCPGVYSGAQHTHRSPGFWWAATG